MAEKRIRFVAAGLFLVAILNSNFWSDFFNFKPSFCKLCALAEVAGLWKRGISKWKSIHRVGTFCLQIIDSTITMLNAIADNAETLVDAMVPAQGEESENISTLSHTEIEHLAQLSVDLELHNNAGNLCGCVVTYFVFVIPECLQWHHYCFIFPAGVLNPLRTPNFLFKRNIH